MSYEEIDRTVPGTDVFTAGAQGRYAKAKETAVDASSEPTVKKSEKKKKAPKPEQSSTTETMETTTDNAQTTDVAKPKKKKKTTTTEENGETAVKSKINETVEPTTGGDAAEDVSAKPKKKRAPKIDPNTENIDPVQNAVADEPVKKKKPKAPKATTMEADTPIVDEVRIATDTDTITEAIPKPRKKTKTKAPKLPQTTDNFDLTEPDPVYAASTEIESGTIYGETFDDAATSQPPVDDQGPPEPGKSEYETEIINAFSKLSEKVKFGDYVGADQWCVIHLPKSARSDQKSLLKKMMPGKKDDKMNMKTMGSKVPQPKQNFLQKLRTGMTSLVVDENNLIFGDQSNYDVAFFPDEEDGVDTDNLHRYAQKLRELEDADREVNPEFMILRNGKTTYGVHEEDAEGKVVFQARKPIHDRGADQTPDADKGEKRSIFGRLKNQFTRGKDKDGKGGNSPKSSNGTPDVGDKRRDKKGRKKSGMEERTSVAAEDVMVD